MAASSKIKLITFDAYNTLLRPKGSISAQYVEIASKFEIKITQDQVNQHFGQAYKKQVKKAPFFGLSQGMTPEIWWKELVYSAFVRAGLQPKELEPKFDRFFDVLYNRFTTAEAYSLFPDTISSLTELKENGYRMGVITNSDERIGKWVKQHTSLLKAFMTAEVIKNLNINKYFDFVITSSMVGYEKPDKIIYDQALKLAGNILPENALHIGDDIERDYFGALKAGWNAVLLERNEQDQAFTPAMIVSGNIPKDRPKQILALTELYPHISTLYSVKPLVDKQV